MLHMCVCMHSHFIENHPIWILEDGLLISEVVLSQPPLGILLYNCHYVIVDCAFTLHEFSETLECITTLCISP
jgi:hypothetical protein